MKEIKLLLLCCVVMLSCKKDYGLSTRDVSFILKYKDVNNADLLNPSLNNNYMQNDMYMYQLTNTGEKRRMDYPKLLIWGGNQAAGYLLNVVFDPMTDCWNNNKATMYLRYKDGTEDTFIGEFRREGNGAIVILNKLWINGQLVWSGYPASKSFTLIK